MILTVTNVAKDIINIFYVMVYNMDQLDRNDNILTIGATSITGRKMKPVAIFLAIKR